MLPQTQNQESKARYQPTQWTRLHRTGDFLVVSVHRDEFSNPESILTRMKIAVRSVIRSRKILRILLVPPVVAAGTAFFSWVSLGSRNCMCSWRARYRDEKGIDLSQAQYTTASSFEPLFDLYMWFKLCSSKGHKKLLLPYGRTTIFTEPQTCLPLSFRSGEKSQFSLPLNVYQHDFSTVCW